MIRKKFLSIFACLFVLIAFVSLDAKAGDFDVPGVYTTIQAAIDAAYAAGGGTVNVAKGIYSALENGESFPLIMKDGVQLIGEGADKCILDAQGQAPTVIDCTGVGNTTRIEGFKIMNAISSSPLYGGGIYLNNSNPIIANNIITGNVAWNGGGINSFLSSPVIIDNIIIGNSAINGGGIICYNYLTGYATNFIVANNIIVGNSASSGGGGIYSSFGATLAITNNTIVGNTARWGGGIYCYASENFGGITNNIIAMNTVTTLGGGIYINGGYLEEKITFNDVWNNVVLDGDINNYNLFEPPPYNISEDPLFMDSASGDYHLQFESPCIDAGDNLAPGLLLYDFEGDDRIVDGNYDGEEVVDLGADEYPAPPVAEDDDYSVNEDDVLTVEEPGVLGNDSSSDEDDILVAVLVDDVSDGGLTLNDDGSFTYTPDENFNGIDSFTYKAYDGEQYSLTATVRITVDAVNDAPVGTGDEYSVEEDNTLTVPDPGVLANDEDVEGDILYAVHVMTTSHGVMALDDDGAFTYWPYEDYYGPDSFTYRAGDGELESGIVTVNITVIAVNDPPVADNQSTETDEDIPLDITLTAADVDDSVLGFVIISPPSHGTLGGTAPALTYTPALNYYGTDSFTFKVSDGEADSNVATVMIDINPVNDAPVANDQSVTTDEDTAVDITLTASDVEGDELSYSLAAGPSHGTLSGTAPALTYTPSENYNGSDSFTFTVNDGELDSSAATVSITINPVNDLPEAYAGHDQTAVAYEQCQAKVTLDGTGSSDVDGDSLTYTWEGPFEPVQGPQPTVTLGVGTHEITLTVDDGNGGTATAVVLVTVKDQAAPTILLSESTCVNLSRWMVVNILTVSASDNCSSEVELTIDKVEIFNKRGHRVWGRGIYRVDGNNIYVNPNGRDWSICVKATAIDASGNTRTDRMCQPLMKCNRWSEHMVRLIWMLFHLTMRHCHCW